MGKQRYEFFECVDKEHFESLVWRLLGQSKWRQCMRTIKYNLSRIKEKTGLDVNDTEDNFKLNFIMIAKRVLEKEKCNKQAVRAL